MTRRARYTSLFFILVVRTSHLRISLSTMWGEGNTHLSQYEAQQVLVT
jgi:hypothetical protein